MRRATKICTRRSGHGSQRSYNLQNLTEIEILEFDRRLEGAPFFSAICNPRKHAHMAAEVAVGFMWEAGKLEGGRAPI
jgi:hypothetical protein